MTPSDAPKRPLLFVHSSDEMYGSDRILLEVLRALPPSESARAIVWLPTDSGSSEFLLSDALRSNGFRCDVLPLPILRRRYMRPSGLVGIARRWRAVRSRIRELDPEIVYCATSAALPASIGLTRSRTRMILHNQELWKGAERILLGLLSLRSDRIICISGAVKDRLPRFVKRKAVVVTNAVGENDAPRRRLDATARRLQFVIASRWLSWKGHETLLTAWDEGDPPGVLRILGGPPPLGSAVDVAALVERLTHPESVEIVGEVSDITAYIDDADILIVPTDTAEPFGLVAIEAFSRGRGVIASNAGGLSEIVRHDVLGALFPPRDHLALATALRSVTPASAERWGDAARAEFETRYAVDAFHSAIRSAVLPVVQRSQSHTR